MDGIDHLFDTLMAYDGARVFNQYRDETPVYDRPGGAEIRRRNLRQYLEIFAGARYILVGEAAGYAGCRFSGIPFTCEAQLVGPEPLPWAVGRDLSRSSVDESSLWVEMSARIVWGALGTRTDCVLWNAFPWHPFGDKPLSNRPPGRQLEAGLPVLEQFLALFPAARPYAIGRVAQRALARIGVDAPYIRHPSHGGKRLFVAGVAGLV